MKCHGGHALFLNPTRRNTFESAVESEKLVWLVALKMPPEIPRQRYLCIERGLVVAHRHRCGSRGAQGLRRGGCLQRCFLVSAFGSIWCLKFRRPFGILGLTFR